MQEDMSMKILVVNPGSTSTKIAVYPGEEEMEALALGILRVLDGKEEAKEY